MDEMKDEPGPASNTLFARAIKQQWPALAPVSVSRMGPIADQNSAGQPPPSRNLVTAAKGLLAAGKLNLDTNGTEHERTNSNVTLAPVRQELLHDPQYLEFLRSRATEADSHAGPVHANGDEWQVENGPAPGSA